MKNAEDGLDPELKEIVRRVRDITNDRLLRLPQAKEKIGMATSTFWKCVKSGTLPSSVSLGPHSVAWRESELQAWIDANTYASRSKRRVDMKLFIAALTSL
ncbi:helix-turn-helix transcriptional regulator [Massilia timonae]|uniref:helix-turn-helix transcriptional regulator n=1 Tax=Massilia timonae TaxID=47229 RepID=UPI002356690C|nr:AlpA family phage regulatory protein [Massilia timonae]